MTELKEFVTERGFVTDRISNQVRLIAIGLLATTWSLLIGQVNILKNLTVCFRPHFILISTIAIIVLAFDFLQYFFSFKNINMTIEEMVKNNLTESNYNYDDKYYKWSNRFFITKQYVLLIGICYFIICMFFIIIL
jgi:hypothetical protein